jgi:hypothetical protein
VSRCSKDAPRKACHDYSVTPSARPSGIGRVYDQRRPAAERNMALIVFPDETAPSRPGASAHQ